MTSSKESITMAKILEKEALDRVESKPDFGLNDEQVNERKAKGYVNVVKDTQTKSIGKIIFDNVFTLFNCLLFIIAIIFLVFIIYLSSTGNQDVIDKHFGFSKFIFLIPLLMNVTVGTIQEIHSRNVLNKLKIVTSMKSRVIRNGKEEEIESASIVTDDVVCLKAGEQAVCDMIVLEGNLHVDESMLTGEADHVKKMPGDLVYSGSAIIVGKAKARVEKVGQDTYVSELQRKVKSVGSHKSELMSDITKILKVLSIVLLIVTATIIGTLVYKINKTGSVPEIWDGMTLTLDSPVTWARIMITAGSFAIGIIPSGLILTTSVTLMISIASLSRQNTLIQQLYSLENLSRVDTICLDKTGTLTDGTMKLVHVERFAHLEDIYDHIKNLLGAMDNRNQTADALFNAFGENKDVKFKQYLPFSSEKKSSGLIYENGDTLTLGAPEYLLEKNDKRLAFVEEKAKEGKRVIAFKLNDDLLAFFVIEDQIRASAPETLKFFRDNAVNVKVISGDNPLTVSKIAETCGIQNADKAISLEGMPLEKVKEVAKEYTIFARVSPEQKAALVEALQSEGHKVAMTGDGVNDILALRKADSSITFAKATDAAKSCSDVVLLDNDFSHLKEVVGQGRRVINNIQRTSILFLMKTIAIITLAFALIPFKKGQMWYTVENAYLLESTVIGTGGFLLSLEGAKLPIRGKFIDNIARKALASGLLAALAIVIPVIIHTMGVNHVLFYKEVVTGVYTPHISETDAHSLMTLMLVMAGVIVTVAMCIPFNKWRWFVLGGVAFTGIGLSMMLPTTFLMGQPLPPSHFRTPQAVIDAGGKDSIGNWPIVREFFQPWNSSAVQSFFSNGYNFLVILIFFVIALPIYIVLLRAINKGLERKYALEVEQLKERGLKVDD